MRLYYEYRQVWLQVKLRYFNAAREHLTRMNPCHPDLPAVLHRISELEDELRQVDHHCTAR